ncbi:MAG: carbohydrate ABC transporter permease [Paenibacillus macerans]|uniref:Binding--dependent transport system inner membrane component family protein n=1 Tax=Paenibacillus macerans TaxID=44252 RepID=A0A091A1U9_PAEMA|nr:carbohydrate ABC transporter permease [Paenibacillus macerans]KFN10301.1 binding--dependent transport system inner membrane component family protein [Paenibacillus macerans]MBS5914019.1 carbohydrate ABC transporter permease [Paenibacillus macerans]MCY7561957.1 carbohydrate ABC transporter permease [Paenibacillus macerans]MDU7473439.1 carbohydrate ABC transporter permease [Paenibacillus macerans]MEC0136745.1 carbohydrate ABC transporter permease [Paenibacillus macerans]
MPETLSAKFKKQWKPVYLLGHILLLGIGLILLYPLIFMVLAGFFTKTEFTSTVLGIFPIPKAPTLENFKALIVGSTDAAVTTYLKNSIIRTAYNTFWAILTSFLAGYVFARLRFKGRDTLFLILLATQMIPGTLAIIPTYLEFARFPFAGGNHIFTGGTGILDSWWIYLIGGPAINIMGTFLVKQSLEKVPLEIDEAAIVDGAGTVRLIFQILFPLQLPIMAFIAITTALGTWNDFITPFFYTTSDHLQTLPAAITRLSSVGASPGAVINYPMIITLSLGITLPALLIFAFFQKYIVQGLANTGIKG